MLKRPPSIESLRVLEACVRHANFTRAAAELALTPAAISLRIRNLEAELGIRLFHRSGPRVSATPAARRLAEQVADALHTMHTAVESCREGCRPLRVTAVPSFAARWLAPRLERYHRLPGSVPVRLDVSAELQPKVAFDLAIRTGSADWQGFEVTRLTPIEATPMMSPALAASVRLTTAADLAQLPLLPHPDWQRWFHAAGVGASGLRFCASEFPTHELDAIAAMQGAGVALLSPSLFAGCVAEGRLIQPFDVILHGPAWHHLLLDTKQAHPAATRFRSWLQDEIQHERHPR